MNTTVGPEGWATVHSARQKHYDGKFYGQFLGARKNRYTENTEWIVATMYPGRSMDDGFRGGEWNTSQRFDGPRSTDNADDALKRYVEKSYETFVWNRTFEQDTGEAIDRYLAGPEAAGAPKLSAGWHLTDPGHLNQYGGHTIDLPLHEARYKLLQFLRRTKLSAMAHLSKGVTLDRHQAVELATAATGPLRFEYGYHTYWLAAEAPETTH
ncbi:hypothetical protein ACWDFH_19365 [Streptomyces kronopolitis]